MGHLLVQGHAQVATLIIGLPAALDFLQVTTRTGDRNPVFNTGNHPAVNRFQEIQPLGLNVSFFIKNKNALDWLIFGLAIALLSHIYRLPREYVGALPSISVNPIGSYDTIIPQTCAP